jgi:hypothetical protein
MVERIDQKHPLIQYLTLYDKNTMEPILDPCFSEYVMRFVCGHERSFYSDKYEMKDQYCDECQAMRDVKSFDFIGVDPKLLDYDRRYEIELEIKEWDCESKSGRYLIKKPKRLPSGKYIASNDYMAAPNWGTFSEDERKQYEEEMKQKDKKESKIAELALANYSDQKSVTVFEVPEYALNVPLTVELLKRYLELPDVIAIKMIQREQRGDGTFNWERGDQIDVAKLQMPQAKEIPS